MHAPRTNFANRKIFHNALAAGMVGCLTSLLFSFVVLPRIQHSQQVVLDPDGFGLIAHSLANTQHFAYHPETEPTINRGPLYPGLVAFSIWLSGGRFPQPAQAMQALFFGTTCALVVLLTAKLGAPHMAIFTGLVTAIHPFVIWYTGRIWVETVATLCFTACAFAAVVLTKDPSTKKALALGVIIGVASLTKGLFLPFVALLPFLLVVVIRPAMQVRRAAILILAAICVIAPWTIRNFRLSSRIIPVHTSAGFNCLLGDTFVDHFPETRFSLRTLHFDGVRQIEEAIGEQHVRKSTQWEQELAENDACKAQSFNRYKQNPSFLVKKIILNAFLFWSLSDTPRKSLVVSAMQAPLFALSALTAVYLMVSRGPRAIETLPFWLAATYYALHLPVIACARYSVVITPVLISALPLLRLAPRKSP